MRNHVERFGGAAESYEAAGELQNYVSERLAEQISASSQKPLSILEIGCGTGFLTKRLHSIFGEAASYVVTDLSEDMLHKCKSRFNHAANMEFMLMDGQDITLPENSFDLIVMSMTPQWFKEPVTALENTKRHLKAGGATHYSVPGYQNFGEWGRHLNQLGYENGLPNLPLEYPGEHRHEFIPRDYGTGRKFLKMLIDTGAGAPRPDYQGSSLNAVRAAAKFDGKITWHIVYGQLTNG